MLKTFIAIFLGAQLFALPNIVQSPDFVPGSGVIKVVNTSGSGLCVLFNNLTIMREVGNFEFFRRGLKARESLFFGPKWEEAKQGSDGSFTTHGSDSRYGIDYNFEVKSISSSTLRVSLTFKTPDVLPSGAEIGICKLDGNLFRGGAVSTGGSLNQLPLAPRSMKDRTILEDEQKIRIISSFADVEISPIDSDGISLSDLRLVPWDRQKSFYVYAIKRLLVPGQQNRFSYEIKVAPPSLVAERQFPPQLSGPSSFTLPNGRSGLLITPHKENIRSNLHITGSKLAVSGEFADEAVQVLQEEIEFRGYSVAVKKVREGDASHGTVNVRLKKTTQAVVKKESFKLDVDQNGAVLHSNDLRGCLNGIYSLLDKTGLTNHGISFPYVSINDWPEIPIRGMVTEMLPPGIKDIGLFKRYIRTLSRARCNTLILYHYPEHVKVLQSGKSTGSWWNKKELQEIAQFAKSRGIEVIPGMMSKFDVASFPAFVSGKGEAFYNPFDDNSYRILFGMYQTIIDIYHPSSLLIGHDEIKEVGKNKPKELSDAQVFAYDVKKINNWLRARNVRTLMFGDMLLDHNLWENTGGANSNNPLYGAKDTHKAIELLPRDLVILDWHYRDADSFPTIGYFREKGFNVWGVYWKNPRNGIAIAKSVRHFGAEAVLASDWGFWSTLSPANMTLAGLKAAWNCEALPDSNQEKGIAGLADALRPRRDLAKSSMFVPVNLQKTINSTTWDRFPTERKGFLQLGGGLDLRFFPEGLRTFADLPFKVISSSHGTKNNCIVSKGDPAQASVKLEGLKTSKIAFLHTLYLPFPQTKIRHIGSYQVIYENGKKVPIDLFEGYNISDFRVLPYLMDNPWGVSQGTDILLGSYLGWRGTTVPGIPANVQVMIWKNPFPDEPVKEIRLMPQKDSTLILLALSAQSQ